MNHFRRCDAFCRAKRSPDCVGKNPAIFCGSKECNALLDSMDTPPVSPAVGVARELLDFLEHGATGMRMSEVMFKFAGYMLKYAEALGRE